MKIVIFEGIATSGKSTVISKLQERLSGQKVLFAGESETHEPIMSRTNELHLEFFEKLIKKLIDKKPDLIIFDRLYLTQAFRANVSLAEYHVVEDILAKHDTLMLFLKVDEDAIEDRVGKAAEHREERWGEYIKTKGKDMSEVATYYADQQQSQLSLLKTSRLPYLIYDTTNHDYETIVSELLDKLI